MVGPPCDKRQAEFLGGERRKQIKYAFAQNAVVRKQRADVLLTGTVVGCQ